MLGDLGLRPERELEAKSGTMSFINPSLREKTSRKDGLKLPAGAQSSPVPLCPEAAATGALT